jgi:NADH dehydrogenase/NADH:ubiquinone oxidoreductase subunit G
MMSELINIKFNGNDYQVPAGMNLVDAADSVGIHIPNLCYLKGMKGIGACRMCMVEINGKMATACTMKTKDGMDVVTESEKITEIRRFVIDLILSMHPLDCMTCTKSGVCQLQRYAYELEVKESSYRRKRFDFPVYEANPFIKIVPDYCIMCGRCVRVCKEQDTNVLDFKGRGIDSRIATANDKPLKYADCTFCGSCLDACPVNAILEADRWRKGREWDYKRNSSVCLLCGNACDIMVSTYEGDIVKINAASEHGRADRFICAIGRFGFDCRKTDTRIAEPFKKVNGKFEQTTWDDVLSIVADKIKNDDVGIVSTARITTNEDALALKSFAEKAGITNVGTTISLYGDESSLLGQEVDIEDSDLIVVVKLDPSQWDRILPALDAIIRKKVKRGTKLVAINNDDVDISLASTLTLKGDEAETLKALAKALIDKGLTAPEGLDVSEASVNEDIDKAAQMYLDAKNPVIISLPSLYEAASNIALIKGASVSIPIEPNAKGVLLMGLTGTGKSYTDMINGGVKTLYSVGEIPLTERPDVDFLIVQTSHMTKLAQEADVILPSSVYLEKDGTVVDYEGRLRHLTKIVEPVRDSKSHKDIFLALAEKMGIDLKAPDEAEIKSLVHKKITPSVKPFAKREGLDFDPVKMVEKSNVSVMSSTTRSCF